MGMTACYAKEISLVVWRYLAAHPEVRYKHDLPPELYSLVKDMALNCPLCEFFLRHADPLDPCYHCPLVSCKEGSPYLCWARSESCGERASYANMIVASIEAWNTDALPFF